VLECSGAEMVGVDARDTPTYATDLQGSDIGAFGDRSSAPNGPTCMTVHDTVALYIGRICCLVATCKKSWLEHGAIALAKHFHCRTRGDLHHAVLLR
jgi:hypothetical protein